MRMDEQRGQRLNDRRAIVCLVAAFLTVAGCAKIREDVTRSASPAQLCVINEKLEDYRFIREHFEDPERVWPLLQKVVGLYYDAPGYLVGSSVSLRIIDGGDLSRWLQGREKDEAVFRQLYHDPQFMFEGNKWKVVFNVLRPDGGVDKWQVVGEQYPEKEYNQIDTIQISTLKPKGTFSQPSSLGN